MSEILQKEIDHYLSKKTIYFKNFSEELKTYLNTLYPSLSLKAQWFMIKHSLNVIPKCKYDGCTNDAKFNERKNTFDLGCSKDHNQKITFLKKYKFEHPLKNKKQKQKLKDSVREKYGVDNVSKLDEVKEKIKETNLEKYGVDNVSKLEAVKSKRMHTMNEKYGVPHAQQSAEIRNKTFNTNIKKYGTSTPLENKEIRAKGYKTNLERYGSIYPMKNEEILHKRQETVIDRYDSYSPLGNPEINKKFRKTIFTKFYNEKLLKNKIILPLFSLDEYKGTIENDEPVLYDWKCLRCETSFVDSIAYGNMPLCPKCFPKTKNRSIREIELFNSFDVKKDFGRKDLLNGKKEIDIYFPDFNLGIEFNGIYWHSEQKGFDKYYHMEKSIMAENKNIELVHIFETEWLEKKEIVLDIINKKLSLLPDVTLKNYKIRVISTEEKENFLNEHYIFGIDYFTTKTFGLFQNNYLLAILSITEYKDEIIIDNYVEKMGINNSFEIFRILINELNDKSHRLFLDRRLNLIPEDFLLTLGFSFEGSTEPSKFYASSEKFINAANINKSNIKDYVSIYDDVLSINENMILNGYYSLWDCGKKVYKCNKKM